MLIQGRDSGLRLIAQHEHGLVAGEIAAAWAGPGGEERISEEVVLATSLHDLAWRELDRRPRWDPGTGRPLDFLAFPAQEKYRAAAGALDRIEELHPYAAVLVSLHYTTFGSPGRPPGFEEAEEERRLDLLAALGDAAPPVRAMRRDLEYLRLFDNLSLHLCLAAPGTDPALRPDWLRPRLLAIPGGDTHLRVAWVGEKEGSVEPWPFAPERLELEVAYRELPRRSFASEEELRGAWEEAEEEVWEVRLGPGGSRGEPGR